MKNFLKETLIFNNLLGANSTFDFITGRDFLKSYNDTINNKNDIKQTKNNEKIQEKNNINNDKNITTIDYKKDDKNKTKIENQETDLSQERVKKITSKTMLELQNINNLDKLFDKIKSFDDCYLKQCCQNIVIYDGNIKSKIMLIGEAPGKSEDETGKPFCGQSGKLLRKALKCINLTTENLFITNTIYWRPPDNRKPYAEEIEVCLPFLTKMIEIINPEMIIVCGATAIETILKTKKNMSEITGKLQEVDVKINEQKTLKIKTFPIYHPSYLLRVPSMKKTFWKHLLILKKELKF